MVQSGNENESEVCLYKLTFTYIALTNLAYIHIYIDT